MKGGSKNHLPLSQSITDGTSLRANFRFMNITGHGGMTHKPWVVPPKVCILFPSRSGFSAVRGASQLKCINEFRFLRAGETEAQWYDRIYNDIRQDKFFSDILYKDDDIYSSDYSAIYMPGDVIPDLNLSFINSAYPYLPFGIWNSPIPNDIYQRLLAINDAGYAMISQNDELMSGIKKSHEELVYLINQQFATEEEEIYTHSIGSKFVNHREGLLSEIIEASQFMQESSTEKGKMTFYFIEACRGADNLEELKLVRTLSDAQRDPHRNAKSLVNINPIANVNKSQKIGVFMGPSFSKGSADYNYGALKKSLADDIELRQKYQALPYWKRFNKLQEVTDLLSPFLHKKIIVNEILLSNQDQLSKISTDVFASYPVLVYGCKENASQPTSTLWRLPHTIEIDHIQLKPDDIVLVYGLTKLIPGMWRFVGFTDILQTGCIVEKFNSLPRDDTTVTFSHKNVLGVSYLSDDQIRNLLEKKITEFKIMKAIESDEQDKIKKGLIPVEMTPEERSQYSLSRLDDKALLLRYEMTLDKSNGSTKGIASSMMSQLHKQRIADIETLIRQSTELSTHLDNIYEKMVKNNVSNDELDETARLALAMAESMRP